MINKYLGKFLSFCILFLFLVLGLNELKLMDFSSKLKQIFYFVFAVVMIAAAILNLLSPSSNLVKGLSAVTILGLTSGGIFYILDSKYQIVIYAAVIAAVGSAIIDMFYKPS